MRNSFFNRQTPELRVQNRVIGMLSNARIKARLRQFLRSREGNIAIISGFMLPVLVGFCGLATESAFWYYRHREMQGAADTAAFGGAVVLRRGGSASAVEAAVTASAVSNGWQQAIGTIDVNTPPTSGAYQNNLSVEVLLTENEPRYFTKVFYGSSPMTISVRAIGTYASAGPACFLALHPNASHAMEFWGNATANFQSCNVVSNSTNAAGFAVGGSANVSVPCAQSAGGASVTANLVLTQCMSVMQNAEPTPDPYVNLAEPDMSGPCVTPIAGVWPAGKHCGGVTVSGNATFAPGIHVITGGDFKLNASANVTGAGVMFFLNNGAHLDFNGNAHMNISAPTSGTYSGIAIFGDRDSAYANNTLNGNGTSVLTGAIYMPSQHVRFLGNYTGFNNCMQVIASTIQYTGNSTFGTNCNGTGLYQIPTPGVVALVE
jgi:hypothetical protein